MAILVNPPCVVFEDEHLLVVNKPPGWNTHSPAPYAGEGIYEWLKNREARWAKLAIIHRLDKETSGLLVFSKTVEGNRSLTRQFEEGRVRKEYVLCASKRPPKEKFVIQSRLKRAGDRYVSGESGDDAETEFELVGEVILARPRTGRTHQIRVHAAESGFPIYGDTLYGGGTFARLCLHARRIEFTHPASGARMVFEVPEDFSKVSRLAIREGIIVAEETDSYRRIHGASDGLENWYVDRFGGFALSQAPEPLLDWQQPMLTEFFKPRGVYHKVTTSRVRGKGVEEASPQHVSGEKAEGPFTIRENGVRYEINFGEGYSVGIFLDQRENRRRLLTGYVGPEFSLAMKGAEVLNTFAYTCAFSVCGALAGARVTSLDLSKKYLEWGRRNFALNGLKAAEHDFIFGDVFDWLKRLGKKGRLFDVVILDPPTFSKSKESGIFRAEEDYSRLVGDALKVLKSGGILFASSNAAKWAAEDFVRDARGAIAKAGRKILREQYVPQPPDFPMSKAEPAYLKTMWLRIA